MVKAVSFDIDTTLTYEVSWYLITEKLGADTKVHQTIFTHYLENRISYQDAKFQLIDHWKKTGKCNKRYFESIFSNIKLKKDAQEVIDYIKSKNILICLITGSVDLYAQTIASRLNLHNWYANTKLVWNASGELVDFEYDRNQGKKKLEQLTHFCKKNKINYSDVYVVGDDENDIELFKFTNHGIAVKSPTSKIVEKYAWKVIGQLSELKNIV